MLTLEMLTRTKILFCDLAKEYFSGFFRVIFLIVWDWGHEPKCLLKGVMKDIVKMPWFF